MDATFVEAPTVLDLRAFFEKHHFQADVQRVFVWLDVENEHLQGDFAQQSQPVLALRDIVFAAAKWGHVKFVILPVPYAASLLPIFDLFMHEFNEINVNLPNVLWLNDAVRLDGARLAHSLGCNALITDFSSVDKTGRVTRKAVRAALRFIRQLGPSIVPDHVDLSDPLPQHQSTSSSSNLHGVRNGGIQKQHRGDNSSRGPNTSHGPRSSRGNNSQRGAPNKWGGGGSHGNSFVKRQGHGNRRN